MAVLGIVAACLVVAIVGLVVMAGCADEVGDYEDTEE